MSTSKIIKKDFFSFIKFVFLVLIILSFLFILLSCNENSNKRESIKDLIQEMSLLESRINSLEKDSEKQRGDYWNLSEKQREDYLDLSEKISLLEFNNEFKTTAFFCISKGISEGFQVIESSSGSFFISLKEITPYLLGYKLVFSIGNPSSATYDDAKLKVIWNRSYNSWKNDKEHANKMLDYEKSYEEYLIKLRNKEEYLKRPESPKRLRWSEEENKKEFTIHSLNPGSWNTIEVHVTPASLEQLDSVQVSIETTAVRLNKELGVRL